MRELLALCAWSLRLDMILADLVCVFMPGTSDCSCFFCFRMCRNCK